MNASVQASPASLAVCAGQSLHFTASPTPEGATYRWTINGEPAAGSAPSLSIPTDGRGPGTYAVGLTIAAPGFTDSTAHTTFTIRPYVPPGGTLTAEPSEIRAGEKSTLRLQATWGQCGGDTREVRYSASEGSISGTTFDSAAVRFEPSGAEQRKQVTITAQLQDAHGAVTVSTTVVVSQQASPEARRLPDVLFPEDRSQVNNCGMRVLMEELRPYLDRDPGGKVLLIGHARVGESAGLDEQRASNAARVLTCTGQGPCAHLDPSRVYVKAAGTDQALDLRPGFCGAGVRERAGQAVNADDPGAKYRRVAVWFLPSGAPMPSFAADARTARALPAAGGTPGGEPAIGGSGRSVAPPRPLRPRRPPLAGAPAGSSENLSWLVPGLLIALLLLLFGARTAWLRRRKAAPAGMPQTAVVRPVAAVPEPGGGPGLRTVGHDDEGYYIRGAVSALHHWADEARAGALWAALAHPRYQFHRIPPGYPEGSPRWQDHFLESLGQCDAVLVVLTAGSLGKQWLNWQISQATGMQQQRDVPIYVAGLDQEVFDIARTVSLLSDLGPTLSPLIGMTWYRSSPEDQEELKRLLKGAGGAATRGLQCFISYSRKRKEFADRLRADLLRVPVAVWRDLEDTPGGTPFREQIAEALRSSTHVLFLLNRESSDSRFVIDEVDRAQQENKVIIPLLEEEIELPLGFGGTQAIRFTDYDAGFRKLLQSLVATRTAKAARAAIAPDAAANS